MNRKEFMERLRELLREISPEERDEALRFYESYFDEAGSENEQTVIGELGSPEQVAEAIKEELPCNLPMVSQRQEKEFEGSFQWQKTNGQEGGAEGARAFGASSGARETESEKHGYEKQEYEKQEYEKHGYEGTRSSGTTSGKGSGNGERHTKLFLLVLLAVLTSPIWGSIALAIFGVAIAILAVAAGVLIALAGSTMGLLIRGLSLCIGAIGAGSFVAGFMMFGIGCILLAIGLLLLVCTIWLCGRGIPMIWHACVRLFESFHRKKEGES